MKMAPNAFFLYRQDTLRECPPDHNTDVDYNCNPSLQFISPLYFVSFVLTAQFVLINVVVAVLMKHLDDSNKEAQEEAEMDAEIELELAQGTLCCMGAPGCGGARVDKGDGIAVGVSGRLSRREKGDGGRIPRTTASSQPGVYSPSQVSVCFCVCVGRISSSNIKICLQMQLSLAFMLHTVFYCLQLQSFVFSSLHNLSRHSVINHSDHDVLLFNNWKNYKFNPLTSWKITKKNLSGEGKLNVKKMRRKGTP